MYDDPEEDPSERAGNPKTQASEKADELRMHAELAAVYEGPRKFDAQLIPGLDAQVARDIQRTIARLEKSRSPESPLLPAPSMADALNLLKLNEAHGLSTNDYHIHRRPGEVMMVRWLAGEQVDTFYERIQAHFDAGLDGFKEDERQAKGWKQAPETLAYLEALDALTVKMTDKYLRDVIRQHNVFVLSTQTADEMNIAYLTDHIMNLTPVDLVGRASAPPEPATDRDLAWFFKLFSLRGMSDGVERMLFFTYLQKTDDAFSDDD